MRSEDGWEHPEPAGPGLAVVEVGDRGVERRARRCHESMKDAGFSGVWNG